MFFKKDFFKQEPDPVEIEAPEEVLPEAEEVSVDEIFEEKLSPINKTTIGKGIVFNGNFSGKDPIEINGTIKGDISTTRGLTVSESGSYKGNANVAEFESNGSVEGNVFCENLSVLGENSVMDGRLYTVYLSTKQGSSFSGTLEMCSAEKQKQLKDKIVPAAPVLDVFADEADKNDVSDAAEEDLHEEGSVPAEENDDILNLPGKIDIPDFFDLSFPEEKK